MSKQPLIKTGLFAASLGLMAFMPFGPLLAATTCLPGVPCVVDATVNDPAKKGDGPAKGPNAAKSESAACDADFMNQIYARAFLEANRETMMNQSIIRKTDSVMQYSCFDKEAEKAPKKFDAIFSDASHWKYSGLLSGALGSAMSLTSVMDGTLGGIAGTVAGLNIAGMSLGEISDMAGALDTSSFKNFAKSLTAEQFGGLREQAFNSLKNATGIDFAGFVNDLDLTSAAAFNKSAFNAIVGNMPLSEFKNFIDAVDPDTLSALAGGGAFDDVFKNMKPADLAKVADSFTGGKFTAIAGPFGDAVLNMKPGDIKTMMKTMTPLAASMMPGQLGDALMLASSGDVKVILKETPKAVLKALPGNIAQTAYSLVSASDLASLVPVNELSDFPAVVNIVSAYAPPQFAEYMTALNTVGGGIGSISGSDATQIFTQMEQGNFEEAWSLLPASTQTTLYNKVAATVPGSVKALIPGNPTDAISLVNGLRNVDPTELGNALRGVPDGQVGAFLSALPPGLLNAIPGTDVVTALMRAPAGQVGALMKSFLPANLGAFAEEDLTKLFGRLTDTQLTDALNMLSGDALGAISGSMGGLFAGRTEGAITNILGGLEDNALGAIPGSAFNMLQGNTLENVFSALGANGKLGSVFGALSPFTSGSFSPEMIGNLAGKLPVDDAMKFLNKLPLDKLQSIGPALNKLLDNKNIADATKLLNGLSDKVMGVLPTDLFNKIPLDKVEQILGKISDKALKALKIDTIMSKYMGKATEQLTKIMGKIPGFDKFMKSGMFGKFFGGAKRAVGAPLPDTVNALVTKSLEKYTSGNFGYGLLGGAASRKTQGSGTASSSSSGTSSSGTGSTGGSSGGSAFTSDDGNTTASGSSDDGTVSTSASSTCDVMNQVYNMSSCNNFPETAFMTFGTLINVDPRIYPEECKVSKTKPFKQEMLDVANNKDFKYVSFDRVNTYKTFLKDKSCAGPAILTGIMVNETRSTVDATGNATVKVTGSFADKICPDPACHFTGGKDGKCVAGSK